MWEDDGRRSMLRERRSMGEEVDAAFCASSVVGQANASGGGRPTTKLSRLRCLVALHGDNRSGARLVEARVEVSLWEPLLVYDAHQKCFELALGKTVQSQYDLKHGTPARQSRWSHEGMSVNKTTCIGRSTRPSSGLKYA